MLIAHKIRLEPTQDQVIYFTKACGVARFAYNWALSEWKIAYLKKEKVNEANLRKKLNSIKSKEYPWMFEVTKNAPQQAIKNLGSAYSKFFTNCKNGKANKGFPKFKCKGKKDSFRADNGSQDFTMEGKAIKLPKIGLIKASEELRFKGKLVSAVVSKTSNNWYVSVLVETDYKLRSLNDLGVVGVDLGIKTLATLSDGKLFKSIKPHKSLGLRLARLNRSLSKKKTGSANRAKAKIKLSKLHKRISDIRTDSLHKLTTYLATNYSTIAIEDLNVSGMLKNRRLARSIADAGFGEFRRQLEYKSNMTGAKIVVVNRFYPSSKTCSACGLINLMPLATRIMNCECGNVIDRDLNAAINIMRQALPFKSVENLALANRLS